MTREFRLPTLVVEKFGRARLDSADNLIWVPRVKHQLITGYYNSVERDVGGYRLSRQIIGDFDSTLNIRMVLQPFGFMECCNERGRHSKA